MATTHRQRHELASDGELADHSERARPPTAKSHVTGPHAGYDRYGRLDHYYYRCERCGLESTDATLADGCWRCRRSETEVSDR